MSTTDGFGTLIYMIQRVPPLDDADQRALQETWNVVAHVTD
jgi:hypothetical protein